MTDVAYDIDIDVGPNVEPAPVAQPQPQHVVEVSLTERRTRLSAAQLLTHGNRRTRAMPREAYPRRI